MMVDRVMCKSEWCTARRDCKRNPDCRASFELDKRRQQYAKFPGQHGYACPSFIDTRESTTRMGFKRDGLK